MNASNRITFLDALRGFAILLVVTYHAYVSWHLIIPYGDKVLSFQPFRYGYKGVNLFFMISGFVIFMTIENCISIKDFIFKRWLRLFPAMLIASVIIFISAPFFSYRPQGIPSLKSLLPGLTFIEPSFFSDAFGMTVSSLEGAFWSLYVEVKFYLLFGISYFYISKRKPYYLFIILFILCFIAESFQSNFLLSFSKIFSAEYYAWFACGCFVYEFYKHRNPLTLLYAAILMSIEISKIKNDFSMTVFSTLLVIIFFLPVIYSNIQKLYNKKIFLFFGFISYPLYLIHENALLSIITSISITFGSIPKILIPLLPFALLIAVGWLIARFAEPFLKNLIRS